MLEAQLRVVKEQILENDRRVRASARETELGRRLMEIPGVGPLLASAFVATVADPHAFRSGRCLSAWIGLVPKQNSSGGKEKLGSISKAGNCYLRQMLVVGAMAVIRFAERNGTKRPWLVQLMARRTFTICPTASMQPHCINPIGLNRVSKLELSAAPLTQIQCDLCEATCVQIEHGPCACFAIKGVLRFGPRQD